MPPGAGLVFTTHPPLITNHITDSMIATVAVQLASPSFQPIRLLMNSHRSSMIYMRDGCSLGGMDLQDLNEF